MISRDFGPDFDRELDDERLNTQRLRLRDHLLAATMNRRWETLQEIQDALEATHHVRFPQASISAQLRHLRKPMFGAYRIEKRRRGSGPCGLWEYRIFSPMAVAWTQTSLFHEEAGQRKGY